MKHRKLRIAWLGVWGLVAVLLIALWVRSYRWNDLIAYRLSPTKSIQVQSIRGRLRFAESARSPDSDRDKPRFSTHIEWIGDDGPEFWKLWEAKNTIQWGRDPAKQRTSFAVFGIPTWFAMFLSIVLATVTAPWTCWRFSLRTLLVAITLMAVVLGMVVWAVKR